MYRKQQKIQDSLKQKDIAAGRGKSRRREDSKEGREL